MATTAIIYGGSRKDGDTRKVIDRVAQKISTDIFDVSDYKISFYDHEHKNNNDDFLPLVKQLLNYERWIFASPVYWYSMSAQLKVFVDRFSDLVDIEQEIGKQLHGIGAAIIATGVEDTCPLCYEDVLINTFNDLGMYYQGTLYVSSQDGVDDSRCEKSIDTFIDFLRI